MPVEYRVLKTSRAIDCHTHVFSASAPAVAGARYRPAYAARLESLQAAWHANGITHGVIVQPSFFGTDNHEMLAAIAADRGSLRGVAVLDPAVAEDEIARLDAGGVVALRLNLKGCEDYRRHADGEWKDLSRRIGARGWHLEVYMDAGRLPEIVPALDGGDCAVVFDHFGNPGVDEARADATFDALATLSARRPVHVKLSGPYLLGGADRRLLAARWMDITGPAGLVWGSDWPWTSFEDRIDYRRLREDLDRWIGAALAPAILWDNAARLYRF